MTTGWNFSTCTCSTMQINDSSSHAAPASQHPYKIKNYCSPVESAAASAASLRTAKQLPALQLQDWTRKHGSEGAAAMQHMQTLKPLKPHKMLKVTCRLHRPDSDVVHLVPYAVYHIPCVMFAQCACMAVQV